MSRPAFIAGDWGTSHLRLHLCDSVGQSLQQRQGAGVAQIRADAQADSAPDWAARLQALTADWRQAHGELPVLLCGMVGANIGWQRVPYVHCPITLDARARQLVSPPDSTVLIAPGLSCTNRNGAPDVMRGEETQILGALQLAPQLASGAQLLCLPGTHCKWVLLDNGQVLEFTTAVTGELFAVITRHTVLVQASQVDIDAAAFTRGLRQVCTQPALLQLIFECRSRQLNGELSAAAAASYLSGLLIGADVQDALHGYPNLPVTLVGAPSLTRLYATACQHIGQAASQLDGERASLAGLATYFQHLHHPDHEQHRA